MPNLLPRRKLSRCPKILQFSCNSMTISAPPYENIPPRIGRALKLFVPQSDSNKTSTGAGYLHAYPETHRA